MNQSELNEWMGGFFDAEGCVSTHTREGPHTEVGYFIGGSVSIKHTYISGVFDGEGYLGLNIKDSNDSNVGYEPSPKMKISHTSNDPLISELVDFSECHGIDYSLSHSEGRENERPQFN